MPKSASHKLNFCIEILAALPFQFSGRHSNNLEQFLLMGHFEQENNWLEEKCSGRCQENAVRENLGDFLKVAGNRKRGRVRHTGKIRGLILQFDHLSNFLHDTNCMFEHYQNTLNHTT